MRGIIATGDRVRLVRPRSIDRDEFIAAVKRSATLHQQWVYPPTTNALWNAYIRRGRDDDALAALVRLRATDDIVGVINLNNIIRGALQQSFVGYYALVPYSGRGYLTDGLRLIIEYAFVERGLHRLEANIQPGNEPSKALARRVGFSYEGFSPKYLQVGGVWRDHERWALINPG